MKVCIVWGRSVFWRPWETLFRAFSIPAEDVYLILDTGHIPKESAILKDTHVIESAAELPAVELVVAAGPIANHIRGSEILNRFDHPKDCIYMFGADNISMHDRHLGGRGVDHMVYIPLPGKPELNAHTAAAIFFYDRVNRQ